MEKLTVEQRIEKIRELAGDDIGLIINMHLKTIHVTEGQIAPFSIYGCTTTGNSGGIRIAN